MYVIDLLKKVSAFNAIRIFTSPSWFFEEIDWNKELCRAQKEEHKIKIISRYIDEYNKILKIDNNNIEFDETKILFANKRFGCDENVFDCSLLNLNLKEKILESIKITDIKDILNFKNPCYCISFTNRNKILGYKVSEKNIERYGEAIVATSIFQGLVSFSIDENDRNQKIEEITKDLCESAKNNEKTYSIEELHQILGITNDKKNVEKLRERYNNLFSSYKDISNFIFDIEEILIENGIIDDEFNEC